MSDQRPGNACIQIGSIFKSSVQGECGSSYVYYQVVGLRGKTLVELRKLQTEEYVDERCRTSQWTWHVWRRPLPGRFATDAEVFTVRALEPDEIDGCNYLQGRGEDSWLYLREVQADDESIIAGDDGGYARLALLKEGKLPSWADVP
ncbi:MAG: hypothetical protein HFF84_05785 [Oscillibacter sp.]|nr:hypothetical protein [Oscillibacter sp.]